jgi:hypothetical protein
MTARTGRERPTAFVRRYAKTWVHALATAALTAFGTLTVVDERFAAVAIAAYVLPPVALYVGGGSTDRAAATGAGSPSDHADAAGETVLLGDGSGRVRRGEYHEGTIDWAEPVKPGSGSSVAGVALRDDSVGWVCATSQRVFETTDGGRTFTEVDVDAGPGTPTDVAATASVAALSTDDGVVSRGDGGPWTPVRVADGALRAVAGRGQRWLACGDEGAVFERRADAGWERAVTPTTESLHGIAVGEAGTVTVGDAGTVLERVDP